MPSQFGYDLAVFGGPAGFGQAYGGEIEGVDDGYALQSQLCGDDALLVGVEVDGAGVGGGELDAVISEILKTETERLTAADSENSMKK